MVGGILAITFAEKAAGEMQERIASTLELIAEPDAHTGHKDAAYVRDFGAQLSAWFDIAPPLLRARAQAALAQAHRMSVSTIHAFAARLLRLFPIEAEIHPDFEVHATLSERRRIVRRVLVDVVRGALTSDTPEGMARVVSELGQARLETLILRALDVTTPLTELAAPPDFRAILDDAGRLRAACLRVVHQVPPASAEKLRRTARGLETLQKTLTQDGVPESAREIMVQLEADLSKEFAAKVMERLTTERSAVEQARTALHPVVRELLRLDLAFVREVGRQITPAVDAARTRLNARGLLSFDDLLRVAEKLLVSQSKVATWVADQYPQILVDEFQDTDRRQCAMLSAIDDARPGQGRLFVVGDPKQSIYAFRGADLAAYTDFVDRLDEPLTLMTSFRSEGRLVRTVNAAFDTLFVPRRGVQPAPGPLSPFRGDSDVSAPTEVWSLDPAPGADKRTVDAARDIEAAAITRRLLALDAARPPGGAGRRWSRYAVLSRVQSEAARLVEVLEEAGIPCAVTGDKEFYRRQEVVDAANLLRVIVDPADAEAWVGLLRCPIGGVPDRALLPLAAGGFFLGRDLQAALLKARRSVESESELAAHIDRVMLLEREIEALRTHFYDGPIDLWLPELERRLPIPDVYAAEWLGERKVTNFQRVLSEFVQVATAGVPPLGEWLDDVASRLVGRDDEAESALADDTTDAVRIMSIHASKGLEFDVVFVPRLDWTASGGAGEEVALAETPDGLVVELRGRRRQMTSWGTAALKSARKEVEDAEVVRLFYVACTRAREQLILCGLTGNGALATHTAVGFADGVMHKAGLAVLARGSAEALGPTNPRPRPIAAPLRMRSESKGFRSSSGSCAVLGPSPFEPRWPRCPGDQTLLIWRRGKGLQPSQLLVGWRLVDELLASRKLADLVDRLDRTEQFATPPVTGNKEFYRRQEVVDAANLLRVIVDPPDAEAWVGLLRCPIAVLASVANSDKLDASLEVLMPTRNVSLTPEQDAFIDEVLERGDYRNASEAVRDAIRALQARREMDALKLDKLRLSIKAGVAALDRGEYDEVEDANLDAYLDGLAAPALR